MDHDWVEKYKSIRPKYERFTNYLVSLLDGLLKGIPHILQSRTKKVDSFAKKISRPEKSYERFEQVTDLSGLRILTYVLGDAEKVARMIEQEFAVDWQDTEDKRKKLQSNQLGYQSVNYVVSLPNSKANLNECREFAGLKAEIQVDTLASHVWSEIEHPIYKGETTVPPELRRRLFLVKGLLEVADLELQEFKEKEEEISSAVGAEMEKKASVAISTTTVSQYIEHSDLVHELVSLASEAGFGIMSSIEDQLNIVSDLSDACLSVNIRTTDKLEEFLSDRRRHVQNFLRKLNEQITKKRKGPWAIGGAYLVLFLLVAAFPDKLRDDFFIRRGWSLESVRIIRGIPLN